ALNLAGIPPFSGFLGKLGLVRAGVEEGTWLAYLLVAGGMLTSLLTLYAIGRVWNLAFWRSPPELTDELDRRRSPRLMVGATAALVAAGAALTLIAGPLYDITD